VDEGVDKVCRHADYVVRSLGTELWKRSTEGSENPYDQGKRDPPAVWKKYFAEDFLVGNPQILSTGRPVKPVDNQA
jgi:hypothetical protein